MGTISFSGLVTGTSSAAAAGAKNLEIIEISRVARSVEKALGCPQDIEWAVDQDLDFPKSLFWLQTRPAKVAAKKKVSPAVHIADLIAKKLGGV